MLSQENSLKSKFGAICLLYLITGIVSKTNAQQYLINVSINDVFNNGKRHNNQYIDSVIKTADQKVVHYNLSIGTSFCTAKNTIFKVQYSQSLSNSRLLIDNSKNNNSSTFLDSFNLTNRGIQLFFGKRKYLDRLCFFYGVHTGYNQEFYASITETKKFQNNQLQQTITRIDKEPQLNIYKLGVYVECYYNFSSIISLGVSFNSWLGYYITHGKLETYYSVKNSQNSIIDSNSNIIYTQATSYHLEPINFSLSLLFTLESKHENNRRKRKSNNEPILKANNFIDN
jgi:hypothetical protein